MKKRIPAQVSRAQQEIADNLNLARRQQRISAEVLAERSNMSKTTLYKMLNHGEGTLENFLRVARCLHLLDEIVEATDPLNTEMGRIYAMSEVPQRVR
ncbi:MAG: hypothetical protein Q3982_04105 [Phoenicibacter congonensis]|uniref:HTH cro/C1-type domain-containing protein n=1 Tax=Phoenicibacter congonensis TaxID=1944646 RepID=A0AA43UA51_9ACTN|nr:hypothetical protein [Phoenicibacter congonensis]